MTLGRPRKPFESERRERRRAAWRKYHARVYKERRAQKAQS